MKTAKTEKRKAEFRVWCEKCRLRIAAREERTVIGDKTYHVQCHAKLKAEAKRRRR